jgi:2-C-methyl-D-erythritol 4-phosphate cytidylyltransferase
VLSPEDVVFSQYDWRAFAGRLEPLYCGGATRRDSVYNGLVAAMAGIQADDWILVHDAARPCLPAQSLQTLIDTCVQDPVGGLLALPCADTVKRIAPENAQGVRSLHTESRASLWLAQTPQMFRAGLLAQALRLANAEVTDEASAIEQMGLQPRLVQGSRRNLKVTYPEDVAMANALLEMQ